MGVRSLEMVGRFFWFADMRVEEAEMIIKGLAPVTLIQDELRAQSDLVDDQLIAGAITQPLLRLRHFGDNFPHGGEVLSV
jgi:hypothetical protein